MLSIVAETCSKAWMLGTIMVFAVCPGCGKSPVYEPIAEVVIQTEATPNGNEDTNFAVETNAEQVAVSTTDVVDESVLVTTQGKQVVEQIDPETVSDENKGYYVDMDDDGIDDFVILDTDGLYFQKGKGEKEYGPRQRIARLEEPTVAYDIKSDPDAGIDRPSFYIYKKVAGEGLLQGYVQKNLGPDETGRIILAEPELLSDDDFDF